jgi:RNA methyltransferase, TrmH family
MTKDSPFPHIPFKEITSAQHPIVLHLVKLQKSKAYRYEQKSVVLEGKNAILELAHKIKPLRVLTSCKESFPPHLVAHEYLFVTPQIIEKISSVLQPETFLAEFPLPQFHTFSKEKRLVALDNVQDPGNLGTIIRTALALGWEGVFLIDSCCDPFNDKALRASKGAAFTLPLQKGSWKDLETLCKTNKLTLCLADLKGEKPEALKKEEKLVLVFGNESHGLQEGQGEYVKVTIPMKKGAIESLNVAQAASILLYTLRGDE